MALQTRQVTVVLSTPDGEPIEDSFITARLDRVDFDNGVVVPELYTATTNAQGTAFLEVWPNARGSEGSKYEVRVHGPDDGHELFQVLADVPDQNADLWDIATIEEG